MPGLLRAETPTGGLLGDLPDWRDLAHSVSSAGDGGIKFAYPRGGENADVFEADQVLLVVAADHGDEFYVLDDDGDNLADTDGEARSIEIAGRAFRSILETAEVYPQDHVPGAPLSGYRFNGHSFVDDTPGAIMSTLIARAQARGALVGLTYDFDSDVDSNGVPWPQIIPAATFPVGTKLNKPLDDLKELGLVDERMEGKTLRLFVAGTMPLDRPFAVLRLGQGVTESPRQRTRQGIRTVLFVTGDEDRAVEVINTAGVTKYGRREGFEGRGGIKDYDVLTTLANESLDEQSAGPSQTLTLGYVPSEGIPQAGVAFRVGDTIRYDQRRLSPTLLEPLRVNSIAWGYGDGGLRIVSVELADQWLTNAEKRKRRVDAITQGSEAAWSLPQDRPGQDTVPPDDPRNVTLTASVAFTTPQNAGEIRESSASVVIDWDPPTQNVDGTIYDDHRTYFVSLLYPTTGGGQWTAERLSADPGPITINNLPWSTGVQARVRAEDRSGNSSDWAYSQVVQTLATYSAPAKASTPTLVTQMGHIGVTWNGLTSTAVKPVSPVIGAEVHVSSVNNFTPTNSTRVDFLSGPRTVVIPPPVYKQPTYVRLVLVDYLGQRGTASDIASITVDQVVSSDLTNGLVTTAKLADAAIVTAKIADAAINDALITSVSAGAIITGSLSADVINAGFIRTAKTGARVEAAADGFKAINVAGQTTTHFRTDGTALLSGTFGAVDAKGAIWFRTVPGAPYFYWDPSLSIFSTNPSIYFSNNTAYEYRSGVLTQTLVSGAGFHTYLQAPTVYGPPSSAGASPDPLTSFIVMHNYDGENSPRIDDVDPVRFTLDNFNGANGSSYDPTSIRFRDSMNRTSTTNIGSDGPGVMFFGSVGTTFNGLPQSAIRAYQSCIDAVYEVDGKDATQWAVMRAASFPPQSNERIKHDIVPVPFRALDVVREHPSKQWRYRHEDRIKLGPMADRLPEQLVLREGDDAFLDLGCGAGLVWAAFAELDEMLTAAGV